MSFLKKLHGFLPIIRFFITIRPYHLEMESAFILNSFTLPLIIVFQHFLEKRLIRVYSDSKQQYFLLNS